ncbi:MAG: arginine deiminase family protein, partial [Actinomycetota bacterium]
ATLESLGVTVRRPDEIPFPITATTQCYSRDPIVTIGSRFIVTNMSFEGRRQETGSYRRLATELAAHYDGDVLSMPPLRPGDDDHNAYLEGGDVFVNGSEIYVGMSGNASNDLGLEWLRNELGSHYTVHKVPLASNVLHLDCAMMLINERQGIVCKHDFLDFDGLPESLRGREWVEVEPAQAQVMATNGVVVNPSTIIMTDAFPDVAERVRAMGIDVHTIPFAKANYFGGGLRCSYQPIERA